MGASWRALLRAYNLEIWASLFALHLGKLLKPLLDVFQQEKMAQTSPGIKKMQNKTAQRSFSSVINLVRYFKMSCVGKGDVNCYGLSADR